MFLGNCDCYCCINYHIPGDFLNWFNTVQACISTSHWQSFLLLLFLVEEIIKKMEAFEHSLTTHYQTQNALSIVMTFVINLIWIFEFNRSFKNIRVNKIKTNVLDI